MERVISMPSPDFFEDWGWEDPPPRVPRPLSSDELENEMFISRVNAACHAKYQKLEKQARQGRIAIVALGVIGVFAAIMLIGWIASVIS